MPVGVARRADIHQLGALPDIFAELAKIQREIIFRHRVEKMRRGTGQISGTLINLVKRVGADNDRLFPRAVYHGLCKRKQGFTAAIHRHDLRFGVDGRDFVTALQPASNAIAQRVTAQCCGIIRQSVKVAAQCVANKLRGWMFGFADMQIHRCVGLIGLYAFKQGGEFLKRVGL